MDPTSLLTAAAASFGNSALGEVAKRSIGEAWDGVKNAIQHKFGSTSEVPELLDGLRTNPGSPEVGTLAMRLASADLASHPEVLASLNQLSDTLTRLGVGPTSVTANVGKIYGGAVFNQGVMHIDMTFKEDE